MADARNRHLRHCPTAAHIRRPPPPSGSPCPRQWAAENTPRFWYSRPESINGLNPRTPRTSLFPPNNGFFYHGEDETLLLNFSRFERHRTTDARDCHLRHRPSAAHLRRLPPPPPPPPDSPYPRPSEAANTPRFRSSHPESINARFSSLLRADSGFFYHYQILPQTVLLNFSGLRHRPHPTTGFSDLRRQHPVVIREDETVILELPDRQNMSYNEHPVVLRRDETMILELPDHQNMPYNEHPVVLRQDETMILELPDHQNMSYDEDSGAGAGGLSEETIGRHLKTRAGRDADSDQVCAVCQFDLFQESDDNIATLHCGHEYHAECIKKWLKVKNNCPMCRIVVM